ncbi:unnamed protein product [Blepharisma stoltei]|uniref:Uncharacterized protein n=1 Tax=Blepharisma stoltei TaxID=1481888 RepID=A0AAU9J2I9_9CILI|nr:unnamed protein product [Blepharisma stoltei]
MGCCECKPEFKDLYQLSPNSQLVALDFKFKDTDTFDDISILSHTNSILTSTIPNEPSSTRKSPPESPRPRSTSYSGLNRKSDIETAFLFSAPILAQQSQNVMERKNETSLPKKDEKSIDYWKRRSFAGTIDKNQQKEIIKEIVNRRFGIPKKFDENKRGS